MTNRKLVTAFSSAMVVLGGLLAGVGTCHAQTDSITLIAGRPLRGVIKSWDRDKVMVTTNDGERQVAPWNIRMTRLDGSNDLIRAKSAFNDERYTACYEELANINNLTRDVLRQELDFYRAISAARIALRGGKVSADEAKRLVGDFLQNHSNSYHYYEVVDAAGDLSVAMGEFKAAISSFNETAKCPWPSLSFKGKLKSGKARLLDGQYDSAIAAFEATQSDSSAEDFAVQSKLIAQCLHAQALALSGNPDEGKVIAMRIIENESSKNIELFAHAYNALGECYVQQKKPKEAIRAFLKTDLLFTLDPDSHAQALYRLSRLWAEVDRPDRAAKARQKLTQRYRGTHWASKSNQ